MAFNLIQAMRKLTDQGKTIVCTIHQPSSEIFFLFDKYKNRFFLFFFLKFYLSMNRLYLLAEGRLGYFGSLEKAPAFFRQYVYK